MTTDYDLDERGEHGAFHRRVEPGSPDQCQAIAANGNQCTFARVEGAQGCYMHGGHIVAKAAKREALRQYNVSKHRARIAQFSEHEAVFSLRDDIGVMRMLVEATLNQLTDDAALFTHSHKVAHLIKELRETIKQAKALESSLGDLLDRGAIMKVCDSVVAIIAEEIRDQDLVSRIAERVGAAIGEVVAAARGAREQGGI